MGLPLIGIAVWAGPAPWRFVKKPVLGFFGSKFGDCDGISNSAKVRKKLLSKVVGIYGNYYQLKGSVDLLTFDFDLEYLFL